MDLPARSFDLARPGVVPPLVIVGLCGNCSRLRCCRAYYTVSRFNVCDKLIFLVHHFDISLCRLAVIRWVEEDPTEILQSVKTCIEKAVENLQSLNIDPTCIKGLCVAGYVSVLADSLPGM